MLEYQSNQKSNTGIMYESLAPPRQQQPLPLVVHVARDYAAMLVIEVIYCFGAVVHLFQQLAVSPIGQEEDSEIIFDDPSDDVLPPNAWNARISVKACSKAKVTTQYYLVKVHFPNQMQWRGVYRYTDFRTLCKQLKAELPGHPTVKKVQRQLPSKSLLRRFNTSFIENRRVRFEQMLSAIVQDHQLCTLAPVKKFFPLNF